MGHAAKLLTVDSPAEMEGVLSKVEHWAELPIHALAQALDRGIHFPLPNKPLNIEEMDSLAARLARDQNKFFPLALHIAESAEIKDWQNLLWARGVLLSAVQVYPWGSKDRDNEQGMAIARAFAKLEKVFLPRCYTPTVLRIDTLYTLPPMHHTGWYCAQAFDALDAGDVAEYVRQLRAGLKSNEGAKTMIEFLTDCTPELQASLPSPELLALADQIRTMLEKFSPTDPAVIALKQSEAYQKVAHLIEGAPAPIWGGQAQ